MVYYVGESETETHLRNEFEVGQIEVTAEPYREIGVVGLQLQEVGPLLSDVESRHHSADKIGTGVAPAHGGEFKVDGKNDLGCLEGLFVGVAAEGVAHLQFATPEEYARRESETEIVVEAQGEKSGHVEAGLERRLRHEPLAPFVADITVVGESEILRVEPDGESQMPAPVVGVWAVYKLVVEAAGSRRRCRCERHRRQKQCCQDFCRDFHQ